MTKTDKDFSRRLLTLGLTSSDLEGCLWRYSYILLRIEYQQELLAVSLSISDYRNLNHTCNYSYFDHPIGGGGQLC